MRQILRSVLVGLASAGQLLALSGCAALSYQSRPITEPHERRALGKTMVTVPLPGADLSIQAWNSVLHMFVFLILPIPIRGSNPSYDDLRVWLEVAPHDSLVRFDPARVRLVTIEGDTLQPMAWWGPGAGTAFDSKCECGEPEHSEKVKFGKPLAERHFRYANRFPLKPPKTPPSVSEVGAFEIRQPTCFLLQFDGKKARFEFELLPGEIEEQGRHDAIRPIQFKKRTRTQFYAAGAGVWI